MILILSIRDFPTPRIKNANIVTIVWTTKLKKLYEIVNTPSHYHVIKEYTK